MKRGHRRFSEMLSGMGISQSTAAEELGCSQATIHYLTRGARIPSIGIILKIQEMSHRWEGSSICPEDWIADEPELAVTEEVSR